MGMAVTGLVFITLMIVLAVWDGIAVYVIPVFRKGKPGVDMSVSRFLQMLPTRSPYILLTIGAVIGHVFAYMPCKECPPEKPAPPPVIIPFENNMGPAVPVLPREILL